MKGQVEPALQDIKVENERLVFRNNSTFDNFVKALQRKQPGDSPMSRHSGFVSLEQVIRQNTTDTLPFPAYFYYFLNSRLEYQVADTVFKYDVTKGIKYGVPVTEGAVLNNLNDGTDIDPKYIKARFGLSSNGIVSSKGGRVGIGADEINARYQNEFRQMSNGSTFGSRMKFVHELVTYYEDLDPQIAPRRNILKRYVGHLMLRIKLEYWGSGWKPASEYRYLTCHIWGNSKAVKIGTTGTIEQSTVNSDFDYSDYSIIRWDYKIPLHRFEYSYYEPNHYFLVEVNGNIKQQILGDDPSNEWNTSGAPLW